MHLGIEANSGAVFEGMGNPEILVMPMPVVSQCKLIDEAQDWRSLPKGLHSDPFSWLFREDSFDPVTRVRRGRIYQPYGNTQPSAVMAIRGASADALGGAWHPSTHISLNMHRYCACTEFANMPNRGEGKSLAVGSGSGVSAWKIVQSETLLNGDVLITLKAKTAFGIVPDLKEDAIPEASRKAVRQALERAVNSAFRETPVSVVDQCRNALAVILSHYLESTAGQTNATKLELMPLSKSFMELKKEVCGSAAQIVARMHSRGKSNEQMDKGLREPIDEDGEFAVHALGLVLRELGWAK